MIDPDLSDASATSNPADQANTFEPRGHPVRWAVLGLVVFTGLIAALWWSGLAAPRVQISNVSGTYDEQTQEGSATVVVSNEGPFTVKIVGVRSGGGDHEFRLSEQTEIEPGQQAETTVLATVACDAITSAKGSVQFDLVVQTAVGIEREVSDRFGTALPVFNCPQPG